MYSLTKWKYAFMVIAPNENFMWIQEKERSNLTEEHKYIIAVS